jgi:hypothetical protein
MNERRFANALLNLAVMAVNGSVADADSSANLFRLRIRVP